MTDSSSPVCYANLSVYRCQGDELRSRLDDLARLRIEVFRAWPYLYDGDMAYEREYLQRYAKAKTGTIIVAADGDAIVGASTALALDEEADYVRAPFIAAGLKTADIFYFGESVLLPQYRGHGIGVAFFEQREAAAKQHGFKTCCFCAVQRPDNHPMKPADYTPLDAFWGKRGYARQPQLVSSFKWQDIGETEQSSKPMVYWMKHLS